MRYSWKPELSVGDAVIDRQHRELLQRFNRLQTACQHEIEDYRVRELFDFLDNYVMEHFASEERVMYQHRYPEIMRHQQEHLELITKLRRLKRQLHEYQVSSPLVIDLTQTMFRWIVEHIQSADVELGRFLSEEV